MSIDDVVKEKLLSKAREAARNSYSPYSLFRVGACLLCADGSMLSAATWKIRRFRQPYAPSGRLSFRLLRQAKESLRQ